MALLDRLFGDTPDIPPVSPKRPARAARGGSGRQHTGGFLDYDEISNSLRGRAGLDVFEKMWRTDSDCRRAITLCVNPIVAGTWSVEPYEDDQLAAERSKARAEQQAADRQARLTAKPGEPGTLAGEFTPSNQRDLDRLEADAQKDAEVAAFVEWVLFEHMTPKFHAHLWTALTVAARMGFAPFEQVHEQAEWHGQTRWVLKTLDLRRPQSIDRWVDDGAGKLLAIAQFTPGGNKTGRLPIPAGDLVYYRFGAEGDNWEGQSLLRPAYKHWRRKDGLELIDAISHEKTAMGVPTGYPPASASDEELDEFAEFLANVRASSDLYFMAPGPAAQFAKDGEGWHWEFVTPGRTEGATQAMMESLKYHTDKIAAVVVAEFMRLGQSGTGARATADVQQDPFWMLAETLAQIVVEDTINEQLIPRLVDLNYDVAGRYPRIKCSLIDSTSLEELAGYVERLAKVNAIRVEPTLEAYLRDRADLPEADEQAITQQQDLEAKREQDMFARQQQLQAESSVQVEQAKAKLTPPPAARKLDDTVTLARQDRPLRLFERYMSLDAIEGAIDSARASFEQAAGPAVLALARTLAEQAAKGRRVRPAEGPRDVSSAIRSELDALYHAGRRTVREELARQRVGDPDIPVTLADDTTPDRTPEQLAGRAQAAADNIRQQIAAALARVGFARGRDQADLQDAAERAGMAALRGEAQEHAAAALNLGRLEQAQEDADEIAGTYYTSVLDGRRCPECARADDDVLRRLDDPVRLARIPPNPACHGGGRCRCMEAFVLRSEAPASA